MNKLSYGNFDISNGDIAFSATNGYSEPSSELERRKQLSYPLKEVKTFVNNTVAVLESDETSVVQLAVGTNGSLKYRTQVGGDLTQLTGGIPSGGITGQVLRKKSNSDYDTEWGSNSAFSFVGMVVMGTNLTTEASVKAIYGSGTSWALLSSVILGSEHVFGNGKALGISDGTDKYGLKGSNYNYQALLHGNTGSYGKDVSTTSQESGTYTLQGVLGVPTKNQLGDNLSYSGLVADTKTVYSWERTA